MIKTEKSPLGKKGEQIAYNYLVSHRYNVLEINWRFKHKEIDIIAMKNSVLHIVEVKTRSTEYFERPQDAVNRKKQSFLIQAAQAYIIDKDFMGETQFDVISIICNNSGIKIHHIKDAFYPI